MCGPARIDIGTDTIIHHRRSEEEKALISRMTLDCQALYHYAQRQVRRLSSSDDHDWAFSSAQSGTRGGGEARSFAIRTAAVASVWYNDSMDGWSKCGNDRKRSSHQAVSVTGHTNSIIR